MADASKRGGWQTGAVWVAVLAIMVAALAPFWPAILRALTQLNPHPPDWAAWAQLPATVQAHVAAAVVALGIGIVILLKPKGTGFHKTVGWAWVLAMGATAVSSLFITGLNGDFYSLVHLLSGWTIVALPMGVVAIRNRKVIAHKRAMTGIFVGGLLVAGSFAFLPGRFMFEFLLG